MDGVLIKRGEGDYRLFVNDTPFGQSKESPYNKLSLKNCEAIVNGYDLDELSLNFVSRDGLFVRNPYNEAGWIAATNGFVEGFQKALSILGDKNFSEEDVISMIEKSRETGLTAEYIILTNQQTEWDVEICCYVDSPSGWLDADSFNSPLLTNTDIPKLDSNSCLILKRK